jgi:UDP-N-acetylmuramate--alanine ligase
MRALAEMLRGLGCRVSGSDACPDPAISEKLALRGIVVRAGHRAEFVPDRADLLIYSPAVGESNPERRFAVERGLPQLSYSQMLGWLMRHRVGISIAGTHGKSTTTAMTACILSDAGLSPSAIVGAEVISREAGGWAGTSDLFVVESCEYQRSFLDLSPTHAVVTGIEPDHFDCYRDLDAIKQAFRAFVEKIPADGSLLIRADCPVTREACSELAVPVETFAGKPAFLSAKGERNQSSRHTPCAVSRAIVGTRSVPTTLESDWFATGVTHTKFGSRFRLMQNGALFAELELRIPGRHNVANAVAAAALAHRVGASAESIRRSLAGFTGIRRRFEIVGEFGGVTLVDDYAHHPTAVAATLAAARERFPDARVHCLFQPHQVSRTHVLMDEFAAAFASGEDILVLPAYAARERVSDEPLQSSRQLVERIVFAGGYARFAESLDRAWASLDDTLRPGDVLITMGAGDIGQWQHEITRRLQRHHGSR